MPPKNHDIPALKERLLIPEVWKTLKLSGQPGQPGRTCHSPFRQDKNPSFSISKDGLRWKDYGTGQSGDVIDFVAIARQTGKGEALRLLREMAGMPAHPPQAASSRSGSTHASHQAKTQPHTQPPPLQGTAATLHTLAGLRPQPAEEEEEEGDGLRIPLQNGTAADRQLIADTRHIGLDAVSLALALGTLTFAIVQGYRCWLLTDAEVRIAEARRLDGKPFPAAGTLGRRKAHTLRGSRKNWPVGSAVLRRIPDFRTLLLVEGGPDYLAALHFACELERWDVLPVAMLGRSTGMKIDPAALELMRGRRVRIYPHADADGGGVKSARSWANQLHQAGCEVDLFDVSTLHRTDGTPIKDLNDCTTGLDEESAACLCRTLLPSPDLEVHPPF